jgi:adenosylcobyric acid synthase
LVRESGEQAEPAADGCITPDTRIFGTYLHGLFDEDSFRHSFITAAREFHRLTPVVEWNNWRERREESLDRLAATVGTSLDMPKIFGWVGLSYRSKVEAR